MKKKIIIMTLVLVFLSAMSSTVLAAYKEYRGQCKYGFDTLTFGNYISVNNNWFTTDNFHNYKYSHTSGTTVNFTVEEMVDYYDGSGTSYVTPNSQSGSSPIHARYSSSSAKYHIHMINDYYTGSYMYTEGSYYSY